MSEEIGLVMSLYDKVSPTLKDIAGNTKVFDKDLEDLEASLKAYDKAQNTLVDRAADLKKAMADSTIKVQEAQKAYKKLKDETSRDHLAKAIDEQEKLKQALKETESAIKANNDGYKLLYKNATEAATAASKADNRVSAMTGSNILSKLGQAGALALVGDVASQWGNALVTSQFGADAGTYFSGALSGAASGAAIGTMIGPPGVGTAIGAGVGGLVGLAGGAAQVYENRNQAFVDYYNGLYDTASTAMDTRLTGGSGTASQRELDALSFGTLISGEGGADAFLEDLSAMAAKTPFEYGDLTAMSKQLAIGFGDDPDRIFSLMQGIGDAGATVGASANDMQWLATALSRMQSTDLAQLGELNMFQDRGIDVIGMLASHLGIGEADVRTMVSKGELGGREAVSIIEEGLKTMFAGAMEEMSQTFSGLSSTLEDTFTNIENAMGEGYNTTRSEGMAAEIEAYGGSLGSAMEEAYNYIGSGKAALENLGESYKMDALSAILEGKALTEEWSSDSAEQIQALHEQYQSAVDAANSGDAAAGFQIEGILETAEAIAEAETAVSDLYKASMDAEEAALTALQENTTALEAATAAYSLEQVRTKSYDIINTANGERKTIWGNTVNDISSIDPAYNPIHGIFDDTDGSHASGLQRVPYDNYRALLHEGERVLTAREVRESDRSSGQTTINVTVSGNNIKSDADADALGIKVADAIVMAMKAGGGITYAAY